MSRQCSIETFSFDASGLGDLSDALCLGEVAAEYLKAALEVTYKSRHYRSELQPFQIPFTSDISLTTVHIRTASAGASG